MKKIGGFLLVICMLAAAGAGYYLYDQYRSYDLVFETNGGNELEIIKLRANEPIPTVGEPSREGFVFSGWYVDERRQIPFTGGEMPKGHKTLYADWGTEGLSYELVGGTYIVLGGTVITAEVVIPKRHNDILVTQIANRAFNMNPSLESVTIPNTIVAIGKEAFHHAVNLSSVEFEQGIQLTVIPEHAFAYTTLSHIVIPASVEVIDKEAFRSNHLLETVIFEQGSQLQMINEMAFMHTGITKITFPNTLKTISFRAFYQCMYLVEVEFVRDSVLENIGEDAFHSAPLSELNLPRQLKHIGARAFFQNNTRALVIPLSVETIGFWAFVSDVPLFFYTSIYVEAASRPSGWHVDWNIEGYHVEWSAGLED